MKIGIIADIHGNLRALESVAKVFKNRRIKKIFCLGDMVGYYQNSLEVLTFVRNNNMACILGNHEAYLLGSLKVPKKKEKLYFLSDIRRNIDKKYWQWLKALPKYIKINIQGRSLAFFHGSPWEQLNGYVYPDSDQFSRFSNLKLDYVFLGHTHYPMRKKIGNLNLINPGSCGQSRDGENKAKAAILDLDSDRVDFIKASYDIQEMIIQARIAGVAPEAIKALERG